MIEALVAQHRRSLWAYLAGVLLIAGYRGVAIFSTGYQSMAWHTTLGMVFLAVFGLCQMAAVIRLPLYYPQPFRRVLALGFTAPLMMAFCMVVAWRIIGDGFGHVWVIVGGVEGLWLCSILYPDKHTTPLAQLLIRRLESKPASDQWIIFPPLAEVSSGISAVLATTVTAGMLMSLVFKDFQTTLFAHPVDRLLVEGLATVGFVALWHWYWVLIRVLKHRVPRIALHERLIIVLGPVTGVCGLVYLSTQSIYATLIAMALVGPLTSMVEAWDD